MSQVVETVIADGVLTATLCDEENRNAGVLSLVRSFGEHWEVEARYSLYLQEFGVGSDYQRQTLLLAAAYVFDQ